MAKKRKSKAKYQPLFIEPKVSAPVKKYKPSNHVWPVVKIAVVTFAGEVLWLYRGGRYDEWDLPGGEVDPGEQPAAAAVREYFEECGVLVLEEDLLLQDAYVSRYRDLILRYVVLVPEKFEPTLSYEHVDFMWATPEQFGDLKAPKSFRDFAAQAAGQV